MSDLEHDGSELRRHWRTVLGCAMAASIGTIGFFAYTNGVFVPLLREEAGFSLRQLSIATLTLSMTVAVLAPFAGMAMDRFGPLRVIALAVVGEALAFAAFSIIPAEFSFYIAAILMLAILGVGSTPPGFARIITGRFDRQRGLALGMAIAGLGLMAIFAPIVFNQILQASNWRTGYLVAAAAVLLLGGGGLLLIASDREGTRRDAARLAADPHRARGDWSGLKRPLFWVMLVGFLLPALFGGGYLLHMVSILTERGFTSSQAAVVQSLVGVAILVGRLGSGAAMDRFFAPHVAAVAFTISAIGCALLLVDNPILIGAAALGIGLTIGAELDIMAYTISRYFGVPSFGRLYGVAYGGLITCGGFSPLLITLIGEQGGGYDLALIISAVGTFIGAVILFFSPRYPSAEGAREALSVGLAAGAEARPA